MRLIPFLLFASVLALGCSSEAKTPTDPPPTPDNHEELRREVERRVDAAVAAGFSGSILVTVQGQNLLSKGYGQADRSQQIPNAASTAFDFGSVMKDFTAAAIIKLASAGKLAVTNTLDTIFSDVPADKSRITISQILHHQAGFQEYHDEEGDFEPMTRLEARRRIFAQTLLFEPGSKQAYSNSGYTLLADIIEKVSKQPFTEYLREELLEPANMSHTGFYREPIWKRVDTAIGYEAATFGNNDPAGWPYTWALVGNGGLVTTVSDLERWLTAIWKGDVFTRADREAYRTHYCSDNSARFEGKTVYASAGGGDYGLGGFLLDCPEVGTRVIIGSNANSAFDIEKLGVELGKLVLSSE